MLSRYRYYVSHSYVLRKFGRLTTQKSPKFGTYNFECLILKWRISLSSQRISAILIKNLRPRLHEFVFIENATIVLHLHIVFISLSYCSLWRPFSKVIVFSRFRTSRCKGKTQRKVCGFDENDITPYNVGSVLWRLFSTLEVVQYIGGITSVLWGDSFSTVGDSFSTVEVVQYSGGDSFSTVGGSFSTVEVVQYSGGITSVHAGG